jgi:hypothetical protein
MQLLNPQEQQMVLSMPAAQRGQTIVQLVQRKRAQQQQQQQQQIAQQQQRGGGLESLGFVPNGGGAAGAAAGTAANRQPAAGAQFGNAQQQPGMRQAGQQGLGLQLPGMLGQQPQQPQQPSINPFAGGSSSMPYRGY